MTISLFDLRSDSAEHLCNLCDGYIAFDTLNDRAMAKAQWAIKYLAGVAKAEPKVTKKT
jgi:hypothetical protein